MRRTLVFLTRRDTPYQGSRFLRATQLRQIVEEQLPELNVRVATAAEDVSDSVVILHKSFLAAATPKQVLDLRAGGNIALADFIDFRPRRALCRVVDGFLASSYAQERFLSAAYADKPTFRILHHADPRIEAGCADGAGPSVGYFGNRAHGRHVKRLVAEGLCDRFFADRPQDTEWMSHLRDYGVHYAIRAKHLFEGFKPFTKGAVAARCGAVVLASRDEESVANLGEDYPFLVSSTAYKDVRAAIVRMRESYGGPDWQAAQAAMRRLESQCSPERIAEGFMRAMAAFD